MRAFDCKRLGMSQRVIKRWRGGSLEVRDSLLELSDTTGAVVRVPIALIGDLRRS